MDCSPPGSSVQGISQAIAGWAAIASSRGSSWIRDWTCFSCIGRWILHHRDTWEALPHLPKTHPILCPGDSGTREHHSSLLEVKVRHPVIFPPVSVKQVAEPKFLRWQMPARSCVWSQAKEGLWMQDSHERNRAGGTERGPVSFTCFIYQTRKDTKASLQECIFKLLW